MPDHVEFGSRQACPTITAHSHGATGPDAPCPETISPRMRTSLKDQAVTFYRDVVGVGNPACRECANQHVPSTRFAATIRGLKHLGYRINTSRTGECSVCGKYSSKCLDTLVSLELDETQTRADFDSSFTREFKRRYPNQSCAICSSTASIEIDHRNPENIVHRYNIEDITSGKAEQDLQYLCRSCNAKKREHCTKRCKQSELPLPNMRRGDFYGLRVYAMGSESYDPILDCLGCPYHEPENTKQLVRIAVEELKRSERLVFNASIELLIPQLSSIHGETFSKNQLYALIRELKLKHFEDHWQRLHQDKN